MSVVLKTEHLTKQFPTVLANDDINLTLNRNEVVAILGENGAGKTTLMNMLYGLFQPTAGSIHLASADGKLQPIQFLSPRDAIAAGLGMVHQHFMLVETLTVTENIILGAEPVRGTVVDYATARREVVQLADRYGFDIDPDAKIIDLSVGIQQRVEILKALYRKAKILILDEPTAVLTPQEVNEFFEIVKKLVAEHTSIIIITHKLREIKEISDRVYVMRQGRVVSEHQTKKVNSSTLSTLMVGRKVETNKHYKRTKLSSKSANVLMQVDTLVVDNDRHTTAVQSLSLAVQPGEIVGIAGVEGNGQSELSEALIGIRAIRDGRILLQGEDISSLPTAQRIERKIGYVPADRHKFGLVLGMNLSENSIIGKHASAPNSNGVRFYHQAIKDNTQQLIDNFDVRPPIVNNIAKNLSGGNQQKLILAREFSRNPQLLVISQPTRGLDVGAIEYIHSNIINMRNKGVGILLFSLELDEIFALSDRILVMYGGKVVFESTTQSTDPLEIGAYMTGGTGIKKRVRKEANSTNRKSAATKQSGAAPRGATAKKSTSTLKSGATAKSSAKPKSTTTSKSGAKPKSTTTSKSGAARKTSPTPSGGTTKKSGSVK